MRKMTWQWVVADSVYFICAAALAVVFTLWYPPALFGLALVFFFGPSPGPGRCNCEDDEDTQTSAEATS